MSSSLRTVRAQFPALLQTVNGQPLTYLDSASTTQKPQCVIDALSEYYARDCGNIKRGMHELAERSTEIYEAARKRVQRFINARSTREIIFTKNTTEGINLVARSWGTQNLKQGDVVLLSILEHHSNIVPWLQLKESIGIEIAWIDLTPNGTLRMEAARHVLSSGRVKLLALSCISNVLGCETPYKELTALAHEHGAKVLLDAAQLAAHKRINVQDMECDFLVFSGHKVYGPTGIGVLYGKEELLSTMPPFLGGGSMIHEVLRDGFTPADLPEKFEAGTPPIAQARGLHRALDWIDEIGWDAIHQHETALLTHVEKKLSAMPSIRILGTAPHIGCISFVCEGIHPHDLTECLGRKEICLRAGHHCCQPLHDALNIPASTRLSVAPYNTKEEIDRTCHALQEIHTMFTGTPSPHGSIR